jgi:ATP-dependent RNA helicase SUPV3L1/SUV3
VWADELRAARGEAVAPKAAAPARPAAPKVDPAVRAAAQDAVQAALAKLEQETAEGHGKASAGAAAALRAVLKEHGKLVEAPLEARVHAALVAAGELEGWQRWSADKVREDLVAKAEGLLKRPEGQALGGRKMQETLRALRDQWKQADQGGVPNHALWKRFDEACNEAHKVVEAWLEKVRADAAEHRAHRVALIEEVKAWAAEHAGATDLKAHNRALHQFADRWRDGGHVGEKVFAELQPQWNEAFGAARAPFETAQKASVERRQAMIAEAIELGAQPMLRIDAVKALQQRWQAEAQGVPLDRRHEQKLWDAFRAPIDEAFNRKTAEREKVSAAMSEHDRYVLDASKALDAANATGDAQKIRAAVARLEGATARRGTAARTGTRSQGGTGRRSFGGRDRGRGPRPGRGRIRRERRAGAEPERRGSIAPARTLPQHPRHRSTSWRLPTVPMLRHAPMARRTTPVKPRLSKPRPPRPSPRPSRSWPCAATTVRAARRPRLRLPAVAPVAVSATAVTVAVPAPAVRAVRAIAATVALRAVTHAAIVARRAVLVVQAAASATVRRASKIVVRAWAMPPSARSARRSSARTWRCASSRRRPMAKR